MSLVYYLDILSAVINISILNRISYAAMFIATLICFRFTFLRTRNSKIVLILIFYLFFLTIVGLLRQNWISYILFDLKNFFFVIILLIPYNENTHDYITKKLPDQMANWLFIGLPISLYYIMVIGISPSAAGERFTADPSSINFSLTNTYGFIQYSVLLLPFLPVIKGYKKALVIISSLIFLFVSFFTLTRGGTFVCILGFISMAYILLKSEKTKAILKILLFASVLMILLGELYGFKKLNTNLSFFIERINDKENFTSFREFERSDFFKFSTLNEIIMGRGMGGAHKFGIWSGPLGAGLIHGMNMTHYGYLYFILKGGIILLIMIYGWAIHSMLKLWRYGGIYKSFSFVILMYLFWEISITKFSDPPFLFLLLISIYLAKNLPKYSKQNKLIIQEKGYFHQTFNE